MRAQTPPATAASAPIPKGYARPLAAERSILGNLILPTLYAQRPGHALLVWLGNLALLAGVVAAWYVLTGFYMGALDSWIRGYAHQDTRTLILCMTSGVALSALLLPMPILRTIAKWGVVAPLYGAAVSGRASIFLKIFVLMWMWILLYAGPMMALAEINSWMAGR